MAKAKRAKRATRPNPRIDRNFDTSDSKIINFNHAQQPKQRKRISLVPRNISQEEYIDHLLNYNKLIVVSTGPAGTGKTYLATLAAIKAYNEGDCEKIVITRPNRAVDDLDIGFLPGNVMEKMAPWWRPLRDIFLKYYSPNEIEKMLEHEIIEVSPLAYMRGRTFDNSWIICDEMQNSSPEQMKMLLTRIGENSRIIVTGDPNQNDMRNKENGLVDMMHKINFSNPSFALTSFIKQDVVRNPIIDDILTYYGE